MNKLDKMRFNYSKLTTPITIYETKTVTDNGIPQKPKQIEYLKCFAHVETVSLKDFETSRQNNTLNNIKLFIRDYPGINNKMEITVFGDDNDYKVETVIPNYRNSRFTVIDAKVVTE